MKTANLPAWLDAEQLAERFRRAEQLQESLGFPFDVRYLPGSSVDADGRGHLFVVDVDLSGEESLQGFADDRLTDLDSQILAWLRRCEAFFAGAAVRFQQQSVSQPSE